MYHMIFMSQLPRGRPAGDIAVPFEVFRRFWNYPGPFVLDSTIKPPLLILSQLYSLKLLNWSQSCLLTLSISVLLVCDVSIYTLINQASKC